MTTPTPPQPDYTTQALSLGQDVVFHVRRAWNWNLQDTVILPGEAQHLYALGITDPTTQRYYVWRRSALAAMILPLIVTAILALIDLIEVDTEGLTALGVFVLIAPSLVLIGLPFAVALATVNWANLRISQRVVTTAWTISTVLPIALAVLPLGWRIDSASLQDLTEEEKNLAFFFAGMIQALIYGITLVPTIVSIPSGVMRGCLRVKALLPDSVLPGWFLVSVAPFYSLMTLIAFIVINQVAGNWLIVVGVGLFAAGPWVHVYYSRAYVQPIGDRARLDLYRAQRVGSVFSLGALVFILIWAFTAKVAGKHLIGVEDDALLKPWGAVLKVLELFSRSLLTSIVFSHIFLQFNRLFWSHSKRFAGTPAEGRYDATMMELDRQMRA